MKEIWIFPGFHFAFLKALGVTILEQFSETQIQAKANVTMIGGGFTLSVIKKLALYQLGCTVGLKEVKPKPMVTHWHWFSRALC